MNSFFGPHKLSPVVRIVLPSANLAASVSPRAIKPGEVRIVEALVGGCKRRVAFFHFDGIEMTTAQEIAAEMVDVVVCCHPNRLPSGIKGKHLLAAYLPPAHLACLTYEGLEVGMGEDGSVVCEYFLAAPGYNESCEASFAPVYRASENDDGSHDISKLREMVHFAKSVGTLVQDYGMQAGDELLNILGGAA